VATAALIVPGLAAAQESQGGSSGGVPLPEIKVVPTTPVTRRLPEEHPLPGVPDLSAQLRRKPPK
jgi:hypothetical protein